MKVKIVYGPPCSGKSTYVREKTGDNDLVYDYDRLLVACSNRTLHLAAKHSLHWLILSLRKNLADLAKKERNVETFWFICSWLTDNIKKIFIDADVDEIFFESTKEECYSRLESDKSRPDKEEWRAIIDEWFRKHSAEREVVMTKHKFWDFAKEKTGERILRIEGIIAEESWLGDEVTPKQFRDELNSGSGDLTLWINSCGGDVFAASAIYTALKEYPYRVTVKVDALAASAASVISMAGDNVLMSPTAMMMIHNPATIAAGDRAEMQAAIQTLDEIKSSIINAYQLKTGLSRDYISRLMTAETWFNAQKAVEMHFADGILYNDAEHKVQDAVLFSQSIITNALLDKLKGSRPKAAPKVKTESMRRRLLVGV